MYILTRYVVWEVLKFFLAALIGLTVIVTLAMVVKEGLSLGLTPWVMIRTMPIMLPQMLGITLPVAMLFAVSSVFGRMTGLNEIVAIKSLGINPMAVVWPVLILASFLSLGTVWMYEIAATWCKPAFLRIVSESIEEIAYSALQTNYSYTGRQFSALVKRVEGRKLVQPTFFIFGQGDQQKASLRAEEAELTTDMEARTLNLSCTNFEFDYGGPSGYVKGTRTIKVPLPGLSADRYHRDQVAMRDIGDRIAELEKIVRETEVTREFKQKLGESTQAEEDQLRFQRFRINRLRAEPYRRWANGFTCLCFAMIGIPVAMLWRHAEVLTNFFACFLPILSVYYPLLMLDDDLATSGKYPPAIFWLGNALLIFTAILLLRKVINH